jgi:hypothetical protein
MNMSPAPSLPADLPADVEQPSAERRPLRVRTRRAREARRLEIGAAIRADAAAMRRDG